MQWFEMAGLSITLVVLVIGCVTIILRYFRYRERLEMIRQGLIPDGPGLGAARPGAPRRQRGLLLGGISVALLGLLLLCAAFFVAAPTVNAVPTLSGLSSIGLIPLPGLLVAFMGVGLLILYVWVQPTVDRRASAANAAPANAAPAPAVQDAELEPYEPEVEPAAPWEAEDTPSSTLDAKAPE
jgi:hypothetical protein